MSFGSGSAVRTRLKYEPYCCTQGSLYTGAAEPSPISYSHSPVSRFFSAKPYSKSTASVSIRYPRSPDVSLSTTRSILMPSPLSKKLFEP